jgi:uncharacterized coiled-coil DUF342 family protein
MTTIRIMARRDGYRRAGKVHSATATDWPENTFTQEELALLERDPNLMVTRIDDEKPTDNPATVKAERDTFREQVSNLQTELTVVRAERDTLTGQVNDLTTALAAVTAERDTLRGQVSDLQTELAVVRAERDMLTGQVNDLTTAPGAVPVPEETPASPQADSPAGDRKKR